MKEESTKKERAREIVVNTAVARQDNIGLTACVSALKNRAERRSLIAYGGILTTENPAFLSEISIQRALRVLRDFAQQGGLDMRHYAPPRIYAGDYIAVKALRQRYSQGLLRLKSAAASGVAQDLYCLDIWLPRGVCVAHFYMPPDKIPSELPNYARDVFAIAEESRRATGITFAPA